MASSDGHLLPQTEFDVQLDLAATAPPSEYPPNNNTIQLSAQAAASFHSHTQTNGPHGTHGGNAISATAASVAKVITRPARNDLPKPRRVRTGCLTCRERHLKCDEALPRCQNCQKSDRLCKRGVRLNFIDTQVAAPPYAAPFSHDWQVNFHDESREIASEYRGGFERYPEIKKDIIEKKSAPAYSFPDLLAAPTLAHPNLPSTTLLPSFSESQAGLAGSLYHDNSQLPPQSSTFSNNSLPQASSVQPKGSMLSSNNVRPYLDTTEEVFFMQVFVEEVGLWMDSMDSKKHFTRVMPFHALSHPMLLSACLACGARHLFLVNPAHGEEKALGYYNSSTRDLLACLQDPNRDTVLCATTAVVLNVYELMSEKATQRMNHIAGARALIKECHWDAKTTGIGSACFWLNVAIELLSCLRFNWRLAWDPDTWGIDMDMGQSKGGIAGDEELWTHRMVYICAKIANFRATVAQFQSPDRVAHDFQVTQRCKEWNTYKDWCDEWDRCAPRSMQPMGYLQQWQTHSKSAFPEVWLLKRSAIVARLFYHTSYCLLSKIHPTESELSEDMIAMQQTHAHDVCGIVAHGKDRGVASVSLRCLAIAAECLVNRPAQEEVLRILDKIISETGWQAGFLRGELTEAWGWNHTSPQQQQQLSSTAPVADDIGTSSTLSSTTLAVAAPKPRMPAGIVNPMMATADFSFEKHPYQNDYVAPQDNPNHYHYP